MRRKKYVGGQGRVAAAQQFREPPLAEDPHQQHLQPAVGGVDEALSP